MARCASYRRCSSRDDRTAPLSRLMVFRACPGGSLALRASPLAMGPLYLVVVDVPQQPIVVPDVFLEPVVPLLRQAMTQFLERRKQRPFRRPALLLLVERRCLPGKLLAIFRVVEAEAVEEILAADQRHVPQAGDALRIGFDG